MAFFIYGKLCKCIKVKFRVDIRVLWNTNFTWSYLRMHKSDSRIGQDVNLLKMLAFINCQNPVCVGMGWIRVVMFIISYWLINSCSLSFTIKNIVNRKLIFISSTKLFLCRLNILAELLCFGDREFYRDLVECKNCWRGRRNFELVSYFVFCDAVWLLYLWEKYKSASDFNYFFFLCTTCLGLQVLENVEYGTSLHDLLKFCTIDRWVPFVFK